VEGRDALGQHLLAGEPHDAPEVRLLLLGCLLRSAPLATRDQSLRRLAQQARWLAARVLDDLAARGVRGRAVDAGELHRLRVDERRVAARVAEHDGVVGAHGAQRRVQRHAVDVGRRDARPFLLVPSASANPLAGTGARGRVADHADDVVPAAGFGEIEDRLRFAEVGEVAVALDEAGHQQSSRELDDPRTGADMPANLAVGTDGDDPAVAHRDRLRFGACGIDRHHVPAEEHEVGGRRGSPRGKRRRCTTPGATAARNDEDDGESERRGVVPRSRPEDVTHPTTPLG
jgi:hypothetical protein